MTMQQLSSSQTYPEVPINENFESLDHQAVYGKRHAATTGLTWAYYGGRWGGTSIANGTVSLTGSNTNYLVVARGTGVLSASTAATNWNDTSNYARVYKLTTGASSVTATEDHRAGPNGVHGTLGASTAGRHSIPIMAAAMTPSTTGGCAALATIATSANPPDVQSLNFDAATAEYAQFAIPMPKRWDEGTVTAKFIWSHAATTTNFDVVWGLQAVATSNDDAIAAAYGTAQTATDTGGTTNDLYVSPETSAITIAGSPAAEDVVHFRVYRDATVGGDTMAIDARLHGIVLYITTNADNDA